MPKFSAQHYNAIAKDIREELSTALDFHKPETYGRDKRTYYAVDALVKLALKFARRFKTDNENFDPLKWLDQCSPDTSLYPLSELWEE